MIRVGSRERKSDETEAVRRDETTGNALSFTPTIRAIYRTNPINPSSASTLPSSPLFSNILIYAAFTRLICRPLSFICVFRGEICPSSSGVSRLQYNSEDRFPSIIVDQVLRVAFLFNDTERATPRSRTAIACQTPILRRDRENIFQIRGSTVSRRRDRARSVVRLRETIVRVSRVFFRTDHP